MVAMDTAVDTMADMDTTMERDLLMLMLRLDMAAMDMVAMDMAVDTMVDMDTTMERDLLMLSPLLMLMLLLLLRLMLSLDMDMEAMDMVDTVMAVDTMEVMDTTMERGLLMLKPSLDMAMEAM